MRSPVYQGAESIKKSRNANCFKIFALISAAHNISERPWEEHKMFVKSHIGNLLSVSAVRCGSVGAWLEAATYRCPSMRFWTQVFFTTFQCYMGRIFHVQKNFIDPFCFISVFHFFESTRMLSIHVRFVHIHTLTNYMRILSICVLRTCICSAYAYEKKNRNCIYHTRTLRIRLWIVSVCWAFTYKLYAYAQCTCTIRKHILSICIWHQKDTENTLKIFRVENPHNFFKKGKISKILFDTFWWVPEEARATILSAVALPQKVCKPSCWAYVYKPFPPKMLCKRGLNTNFLGPKSFFLQVSTTYLRIVKKAYFDNSHA